MSLYRNEINQNSVSIPHSLTLFNAFLNIGVYVLIYIFINNIIVNHKKFKNYILLFCIVIYLFSSIFTAQRTTILLAFIYTLFITYELLNRKYNFISRLNNRYIIIGGTTLIVFILIFGFTRNFFGRIDQTSLIDNVTYYMGNSIEALDLYIERPLDCKQFGEELFRDFRTKLSKYGLCKENINDKGFFEFRINKCGGMAGNIYTGYRHYIHDFGYLSIFPFQFIISVFYSIFYEKINKRNLKNDVDLELIVYSWFILCIFRFSITNSIFSYLENYLFNFWFIFIFWKIFFKFKIKIADKNI